MVAAGHACNKLVPLRRFRFELQHLRQLQSVVYYLWDRGWVHRDTKPANMVYDVELDRFVLVDLGLAVRRGALVQSSLAYSSRYRAPELCIADRRVLACNTTGAWAAGVAPCELRLHEFGATLRPACRMSALRWVDVALALVRSDALRAHLRRMLQVFEPCARRLTHADTHPLASASTSRASSS